MFVLIGHLLGPFGPCRTHRAGIVPRPRLENLHGCRLDTSLVFIHCQALPRYFVDVFMGSDGFRHLVNKRS